MALLTPLGLYLPEAMKAGGAWGEWGIGEVRRMVGYAPAGMEKTAETWKAPIPGYALPGPQSTSLPVRSIHYLFSAFVGFAACGAGAYLLGRRLTRRGRPPGDGHPPAAP